MRLYFDFISPYAYLTWTQIHRIAERHGAAVEPVPVLFAGLLGHHGTKGPAEVPAKRAYMIADTLRKARGLGVPFAPPVHHPFNPLLALRVASANPQRALIDRIYAAVWGGRGENVEDPAVIDRIVREVGLDPERVRAEALSAEGKARLRAQTERAIADGVFGVPTVVVDSELFWGVDSLPDLERFLDGERIAPELRARWAALTPSASRNMP